MLLQPCMLFIERIMLFRQAVVQVPLLLPVLLQSSQLLSQTGFSAQQQSKLSPCELQGSRNCN